MKYRVLKISSDYHKYPECEQDSKEFPHLVKYLDDEMDIYVISENGTCCLAADFFNTVDVREFEIPTTNETK